MNSTKKFEKKGFISTKQLGLSPARNRLEIKEDGIALYGRKLKNIKSKKLYNVLRYIIIPLFVIATIIVFQICVVIFAKGNVDQISSSNPQDIPLQIPFMILVIVSGVVGYFLGRKILNIVFTIEHSLHFNVSEIIEMSYHDPCVIIRTHKNNNNGEIELLFGKNESDIEEYNRFRLLAKRFLIKIYPKYPDNIIVRNGTTVPYAVVSCPNRKFVLLCYIIG